MKVFLGKNSLTDEVIIDDHDTWNPDLTLAKIIAPLLVTMRDKVAVPSVFYNQYASDIQLSFDFYKKDPSFHDSICEKWMEIFDEMIWTFENYSEYFNDNKQYEPRVKSGLQNFATYFSHLWC